MPIAIEQLQQISILAGLEAEELVQLQPHAAVRSYQQGEIILHEGDRLPAKLFAVLSGTIEIKKIGSTGKETLLRKLSAGEPFAAPALFGDGISPATVVADRDCQILTIERTALLELIRQTPDVALRIFAVLTERLQHLHGIVHGLVSERAIVRLAQFVLSVARERGTQIVDDRVYLKASLSYYQIARSIGITYEECVRLFKQIQTVVSYQRGGKIALLDRERLNAIAEGEIPHFSG
ncbi:MAG: Crp/Fnr family transcriptional regulator [Cyanosarcina radialis HA8281-LM2]|jgi:CRP-like cAMP-binding protein|nr:Crp/Fnr family transcriptional regulator [Cyanosarcina radialis HA8281-LM2]